MTTILLKDSRGSEQDQRLRQMTSRVGHRFWALEYTLTDPGRSRSDLVTGISSWAESDIEPVEAVRAVFDRATEEGQ